MFASFVASSSNYTAIYSSFAILFFFMIWLYLAWFILLTGSQVAFYLQHPKLVSFDDKYQLSPRLREKEGLGLMAVIANQFHQQQAAFNIDQLEDKTGLTTDVLQELLMIFEQAGLLVELTGEEQRYQPAQDIAEIKVSTIIECLRRADEQAELDAKTKVPQHVQQVIQNLDQVRHETLADMTLRESITSKT